MQQNFPQTHSASVKQTLLMSLALLSLSGFSAFSIPPGTSIPRLRLSTGLAIALTYRYGRSAWLPILLTSAVGTLLIGTDSAGVQTDFPEFLNAVSMACGDLCLAVLSVSLLSRSQLLHRRLTLSVVYSASGILAVATLAGSLISTMPVHFLQDFSAVDIDRILTVYLSNILGVVVVVPLLIAIRIDRKLRTSLIHIFDCSAIALLAAAMTWLLLDLLHVPVYAGLLFPLIIWGAIRGGTPGVSLAVLSTAVTAMLVTTFASAGSAQQGSALTPLALQSGIIVLAQTGFTVVTAISEISHYELSFRETKELADSTETRFHALIRHAPDAILILDTDKKRFIEANPIAEQIFGLTREKLLSQHPTDLSPELQPDGTPTQQAAEIRLAEVVQKRSTIFQWTHLRSSGEQFTAEVRLTVLPSRNDELIRASIIDISERKQLEARIDAAHQQAENASTRLRLAMECGNVGLWDWDLATDQVFYSVQFRRQLGYPDDMPMSTYSDWEKLVHPDDLEDAALCISEYLAERADHYSSQFRMRHQDGDDRWILSQGEVIRDSCGNATRMLGVHIDMTERRRIESALLAYSNELEQRNKELSSFAYVASHDLKAPLRGIRQLANWTIEDHGEQMPEEASENLVQMIERINKLDLLLADLLTYSRAGRIHGRRTRIDVAQLIDDVIQSLAVPPGFTVSVDAAVPPIETYSTPLTQILTNLLSNAVKHHDHDSGMISVAVAEDQDFLRFVIADDGPGILPKHHDRAFEVFETLSPNPASDSTGIGLAIVKKAVESYGGTISICSDGGRGAAFEFTWPIRITVEEPVSSGQTQPASEINTHSESSSQ